MQMHIGGSGNRDGSGSATGGSLWLSELSWRDMWAMVAKHHNDDPEADRDTAVVGGRVYGESYSHNPKLVMQHNSKNGLSSSSWGTDVMLRVQVPLDVNHSQNNQSQYSKCLIDFHMVILNIFCVDDEWCESWITAAGSEDDDGELSNRDTIIDEDIIVESQLARRRRFCSRIEGYGDVCSCLHPASLDFHPLPVRV